MYYCSELKSMSVLSIYEGEIIGVVDKLLFDKKLKKLIEIEILSDNGNKLILPAGNIYRIGKNAITVRNNQSVNLKIEENNLSVCPIGSKAYTINGEYIGLINEICLNDKYSTTKITLADNKTMDVDCILSSGKNTVIFLDEKNKIGISKKQKIIKKIFKNNEYFDKNNKKDNKNSNNLEISLKNDEINSGKNIFNQEKIKQNMDFLIGRICIKDILNFNNEILIKSQTKITKNHLIELNKYGKIHELMLFSK